MHPSFCHKRPFSSPQRVAGGLLLIYLSLWAAPVSAQSELTVRDHYRQVLRLINNRNYAEAMDLARQLIQRTDQHERIYFRVVQAARLWGKPEAAKNLFEDLLRATPPNPRGYYGLGVYYDEELNYPAAIENYRLCLQAMPEYHFALVKLVNAYLFARRAPEAKQYLDPLLASRPDSPAAQLGLAYFHMAQRNVDAAMAAFDRAQALQAHAADLCLYRQMTWQRVQHYQEQLATLKTCVPPLEADLDDDYRLSFEMYFGAVHTSLGNFNAAIEHTTKMQQLAEELGDLNAEEIAWGNLGDLYFRHADYSSALAALGRALALAQRSERNRNRATYLRNLANTYLQLGDEAAAVRHYEQAMAQANNLDTRLDILFSLGGLAAAQNNQAQAAIYYQRLLELEQAQPAAERVPRALVEEARAFLLIAEKQSAPALAALRQAVQIAETSGNLEPQLRASNGLAELYLLTGDFARSAETFNRALALARERNKPHHVWRAYFGLARISEAQGRLEQARDYYRSAIETLEGVRSRLNVMEERTYFFHHKSETFQRATAALVKLKRAALRQGDQAAAAHYDAEAFHMAERGRARALVDALSLNSKQPQAAPLTVEQVQQLLKQP